MTHGLLPLPAQVVALLSRAPGVLVDARDHHGRTPLHLAAAAGRDDVVVELWAKGAAIDVPDVFGWTGAAMNRLIKQPGLV